MFDAIKKLLLGSKIVCPLDEASDHSQGQHLHLYAILVFRVLEVPVVAFATVYIWMGRFDQAGVVFMLFMGLTGIVTVLLYTAGLKAEAYNEVYRLVVAIILQQSFILLRHFDH